MPDSANYASPVTGSTVIVLEEAVEPTPDQPCDDPAEKPGSQTTQRPTEGSGQPSPSAPIASNAQAVPETGDPGAAQALLAGCVGIALSGMGAFLRGRSSRRA